MKKLTPLIIFMLGTSVLLSANELTIRQSVTNTAISASSTSDNTDFDGKTWGFGTTIVFKTELSPGVMLQSGWDMDSVTRNRIFAEIQYVGDTVILGIGPYFGLFNTSKSWVVPGISTLFQLEYPGVAYVKTAFQSTFAQLIQAGDYYQNMETFGAGLYLPNGIIGASFEFRRFSELQTSIVTDNLRAANFTTEVFLKNFPFKFGLDLRVQDRTKEYPTENIYYTVYSGIIIANIVYDLNPRVSFLLTSHSSILNFGFGNFSSTGNSNFNPDPLTYLFTLDLGTKITF